MVVFFMFWLLDDCVLDFFLVLDLIMLIFLELEVFFVFNKCGKLVMLGINFDLEVLKIVDLEEEKDFLILIFFGSVFVLEFDWLEEENLDVDVVNVVDEIFVFIFLGVGR